MSTDGIAGRGRTYALLSVTTELAVRVTFSMVENSNFVGMSPTV